MHKFRVQFRLTGLSISGHYVQRDAETKRIESSLQPLGSHRRRRIHVLHGLGGIGKTQLAIAYAREYKNIYSAIIWLNGDSHDSLLQSLSSFAAYAGIAGNLDKASEVAKDDQEIFRTARTVLDWLALEENHKWLMIFDNVDRDYRAGTEDRQAFAIEAYFPATDHGAILITTRLPHLRTLGEDTKVSTTTEEQSLQILARSSNRPPSATGIAILRISNNVMYR